MEAIRWGTKGKIILADRKEGFANANYPFKKCTATSPQLHIFKNANYFQKKGKSIHKDGHSKPPHQVQVNRICYRRIEFCKHSSDSHNQGHRDCGHATHTCSQLYGDNRMSNIAAASTC